MNHMALSRTYLLLGLGLAVASCTPKATDPARSPAPPAAAPAGSTEAPPTAAADPAQLAGSWTVESINGQAVPADLRAVAELNFDVAQGRVSGSTSCNRVMGSYTATSSTISFGQLAATRMACVGNSVEPQFLAALNTPSLSYQLTATQLTLLQGSAPVMVLRRAADPAHTSQNSLDWAGTYVGTLPCADCQGIRTELTLHADLTYRLITSYLGKAKPAGNQATGRFSWDEAGRTVQLSGLRNQPTHYLVGENQLIQLDMSGQRISGASADKYVLRKQN